VRHPGGFDALTHGDSAILWDERLGQPGFSACRRGQSRQTGLFFLSPSASRAQHYPQCMWQSHHDSIRTQSRRRSRQPANGKESNIAQPYAHEGKIHSLRQTLPTVLASCCESIWFPRATNPEKPHLTASLWLYCGAHGMRVWLPVFPREGDHGHTFMSKRIMLHFPLEKLYPLGKALKDCLASPSTIQYCQYCSHSVRGRHHIGRRERQHADQDVWNVFHQRALFNLRANSE
jgi:hypothetical protein